MTWASSVIYKSVMLKFRGGLGGASSAGQGDLGRFLGRRGGQLQMWEGLGSVKKIFITQ